MLVKYSYGVNRFMTTEDKPMSISKLREFAGVGVPIKAKVLPVPPEKSKTKPRYKVLVSVNRKPFEDVFNARGSLRTFATIEAVNKELLELGVKRWEFDNKGD